LELPKFDLNDVNNLSSDAITNIITKSPPNP